MQAESSQILTDGERLFNLREIHHMAWSDISKALGVSRSMCHSVVREDKRLGRDSLARLSELEQQLTTSGSHHKEQQVAIKSERRDVEHLNESLQAENESLKAELAKALDTISNLSKALAGVNSPKSHTVSNSSGSRLGRSRHNSE